jgi:hypothetical protein
MAGCKAAKAPPKKGGGSMNVPTVLTQLGIALAVIACATALAHIIISDLRAARRDKEALRRHMAASKVING